MAALLSGFFAGTARADGLIIPFIGVNFGGDSGAEFGDAADASRFNWGASFAWMGGGVFGFEGDFGYSPDFFGKTDLGGSSVFTATGNLLLGIACVLDLLARDGLYARLWRLQFSEPLLAGV